MRMTVRTKTGHGAFSHGPTTDDGFLVYGPQCPVVSLQLRPDLAVCFWECSPPGPCDITVQFNVPVFRFSFVLEGGGTSHAQGQTPFQRKHGAVEVRHFAASSGGFSLEAGQSHRWVDILLRPSFFTVALGTEIDHLPPAISNVMRNEGETMPCHAREMTPDQFVAATQLAHCPYANPARIMYLKSKALELLSLVLAAHTPPPCRTRFNSYEVQCLHQARNILISDLHYPPSLHNLAQNVGLNETKLKRGFKTLFGQTVYGYFRAYRMDHARRLLLESESSVSEVAAAVGYTNMSHFSAAFKERHGIKPSAFRKNAMSLTSPHHC